jgi:cytochrome c oxidase cbb3-type subunit 3
MAKADKTQAEAAGPSTTGHEWDGIREYDRPLPRWWLWTFYGTIAFAFVYIILYPAIPLISSATGGVLGYSTRDRVEDSIAAAQAAQSGFRDRIASMSLAQIRGDEELARFATIGGRSAFANNCAPCHGTGAAGAPGYPNLNDDDWLWGGDLETIHATLEHGVRYTADDQTRMSQMPAFGDGVLDRTQIIAAAEYVLSLTGRQTDAAAAAAGKAVFEANCASCHGADGGGGRSVGAPALNDAIWLYGGGRSAIIAQVTRPRHGVMPAWGGRLDEVTIKELALYVHSLGGGETAPGEGPQAANP